MSHASDGEEIVSTPGATGSATISSAMPHSDVDDIYVSVPSPRRNIPLSVGESNPWLNAATGATGSTTPTKVIASASSSSQKKRKAVLTDQDKEAKIKQVRAALLENREAGQFKDGSRSTKVKILASFGMSASQFTRWQQTCVLCCCQYASHKDAFTCINQVCKLCFCKTCMAKEVVRQVLRKEVFVHASSIQCSFCRVEGSIDLSLNRDVDATRREGLRDGILVHVQKYLTDNAERMVPLMSGLCSFRSKMKANYEDGPHQLFNREEMETVSKFLSLWGGYSGLKVDTNPFKSTQRHIDFSLQWLKDSFRFVMADEFNHWVLLNHQYDGWFAMMIEFGMKCHERMLGLVTLIDIESYPFWEGLRCIGMSVEIIIVE